MLFPGACGNMIIISQLFKETHLGGGQDAKGNGTKGFFSLSEQTLSSQRTWSSYSYSTLSQGSQYAFKEMQ